jgi:hypothetical protein
MGAELTYARGYALFALVGIAGEDDLDAPDHNADQSDPGPEKPKGRGTVGRIAVPCFLQKQPFGEGMQR